MRLQEFETECRWLLASSPTCSGWLLTVLERDDGREWFVTATDGTVSASVTVVSARTTPNTPAETLACLGMMLEELRTGEVDASQARKAILDELTAEAQRLGLGYRAVGTTPEVALQDSCLKRSPCASAQLG